MNEEKNTGKTLYELQPEEFLILSEINPNLPVLVAKRARELPGVIYRIELPPGFVEGRCE